MFLGEENEYLYKFELFYDTLTNKEKIFYIFFTGGLLSLLKKTLSLIPLKVNLVLIGSALNNQELEWIKKNTNRPFFYVDKFVDDKVIWNYLFKVNKKNFGWIDVDCFVFNIDLLSEIALIDDNTAINGIWEKNLDQVRILNTYLMFLNINVIKKITKIIDITPSVYTYGDVDYINWTMAKKVTNTHVDLIRPIFSRTDHIFDTLELFQLIANAMNYKIRKIKEPENSFFYDQSYFSNEAIHLSNSGYFSSARAINFCDKSCNKNIEYAFSIVKFKFAFYVLIYYILMQDTLGIMQNKIFLTVLKIKLFQYKQTGIQDIKDEIIEFLIKHNIQKNIIDLLLVN